MKHLKKFNESNYEENEFDFEPNNIDYIGNEKFESFLEFVDQLSNFSLDIDVLVDLIKKDKLEENADLKKIISDVMKLGSKLEPYQTKLFEYLENYER